MMVALFSSLPSLILIPPIVPSVILVPSIVSSRILLPSIVHIPSGRGRDASQLIRSAAIVRVSAIVYHNFRGLKIKCKTGTTQNYTKHNKKCGKKHRISRCSVPLLLYWVFIHVIYITKFRNITVLLLSIRALCAGPPRGGQCVPVARHTRRTRARTRADTRDAAVPLADTQRPCRAEAYARAPHAPPQTDRHRPREAVRPLAQLADAKEPREDHWRLFVISFWELRSWRKSKRLREESPKSIFFRDILRRFQYI